MSLRGATGSLVTLFVIVGADGCRDNVAAPRITGTIAVVSGDAQRGIAGERLAHPIVVVAQDSSGAAVAGLRVSWLTDDGGKIDPLETITDATGRAEVTWTLGITSVHHARAFAPDFAPATLLATTAVDLPLDLFEPLGLVTYDGSGQTVHPDYVETGALWAHSAQYLFITPYPDGDTRFENPSLFESTDLRRWTIPSGLTNPIFAPVQGYYSDPDAVYVPERNELWLYFRQVDGQNVVRLTTSADGVQWSTPRVVAQAPNHEIISPTVVHRAPNDWLMWSVNGNVGCPGLSATVELRRSTNGIDWSPPTVVGLSQPGLFPWHIDVEWIPSRGEYWALYNAKTSGNCATAAVYLATSPDGLSWQTYPSPVLSRHTIPALWDVVYRSTFAYDSIADAVTIWYSGARADTGKFAWHTAVQRRSRADLFTTIAKPSRSLALSADIALPSLRVFP